VCELVAREYKQITFLLNRGLCSVYRSEAGGQNVFKWTSSTSTNNDDHNYDSRTVAGDETGGDVRDEMDDVAYRNNSHWLSDNNGNDENNGDDDDDDRVLRLQPGNSNYVLYYDAASLYPSSGTLSIYEMQPRPLFPNGKRGRGRHTACMHAPPPSLPSSAPPLPFPLGKGKGG
jgi:hypothetical protein